MIAFDQQTEAKKFQSRFKVKSLRKPSSSSGDK